jgi:hypothetical protein
MNVLPAFQVGDYDLNIESKLGQYLSAGPTGGSLRLGHHCESLELPIAFTDRLEYGHPLSTDG